MFYIGTGSDNKAERATPQRPAASATFAQRRARAGREESFTRVRPFAPPRACPERSEGATKQMLDTSGTGAVQSAQEIPATVAKEKGNG